MRGGSPDFNHRCGRVCRRHDRQHTLRLSFGVDHHRIRIAGDLGPPVDVVSFVVDDVRPAFQRFQQTFERGDDVIAEAAVLAELAGPGDRGRELRADGARRTCSAVLLLHQSMRLRG